MLNKAHAYIGLVLLLPLFIWGVTGSVFLFKPGYKQAYAPLKVNTYSLKKTFVIPAKASWREARYVRTILGWHLLVVNQDGIAQHLHPKTHQEWGKPILELVRVLIDDSVKHDLNRYGKVESVELLGDRYLAQTDQGVSISLQWETLTLHQEGPDTRFINRLYKLHYLQWTPNPLLNKILAVVMLVALFIMCLLSLRMLITEHKWE